MRFQLSLAQYTVLYILSSLLFLFRSLLLLNWILVPLTCLNLVRPFLLLVLHLLPTVFLLEFKMIEIVLNSLLAVVVIGYQSRIIRAGHCGGISRLYILWLFIQTIICYFFIVGWAYTSYRSSHEVLYVSQILGLCCMMCAGWLKLC